MEREREGERGKKERYIGVGGNEISGAYIGASPRGCGLSALPTTRASGRRSINTGRAHAPICTHAGHALMATYTRGLRRTLTRVFLWGRVK